MAQCNPHCVCYVSTCKCCPDSPPIGVASPSAMLLWSPIGWQSSWYYDFGIPQFCTGGDSWDCGAYIWEPDADCSMQQADYEVGLNCEADGSNYHWQWYWRPSSSNPISVDGWFECGGCVDDKSIDSYGQTTIGPLYASNSGGGSIMYYVKVDIHVKYNCI